MNKSSSLVQRGYATPLMAAGWVAVAPLPRPMSSRSFARLPKGANSTGHSIRESDPRTPVQRPFCGLRTYHHVTQVAQAERLERWRGGPARGSRDGGVQFEIRGRDAGGDVEPQTVGRRCARPAERVHRVVDVQVVPG